MEMDECYICGGVGFKQSEHLKVLCRYDTSLSEDREEKLQNEYIEGINPAQEAERPAELTGDCPECKNDFLLKNFRGDTGVLVDTCEVCAYVWFDHGELPTSCDLTQLSYDQQSTEFLEKLD